MRYIAFSIKVVLTVLLIPLAERALPGAVKHPFILHLEPDGWAVDWWLLGLVVMACLVVAGDQYEKRLIIEDTKKNSKELVSDREFMEQYSSAVGAALWLSYLAGQMDADDMRDAQRKLLRAICLIVSYYYDKKQDIDINACIMQAYDTASGPADVGTRLRCKEKMRDLSTYAHILDLVCWAFPRPGLPTELALPVEDPSDPLCKFKLLPGAPHAFALDAVTVVQDTNDLREYFRTEGKNVDPAVRAEQLFYFQEYSFRSFVSIPLNCQGEAVGVLNIQSNQPNIFGLGNKHQALVMNLLNPLITALSLFCNPETAQRV